jgi:integrase
MIHRQNYHDVHAYLRHIDRVRQNDSETVKRARSHLRHLLEWADETPLAKARSIDPTFPTYLLKARADGREKTLAPTSIIRCLANARQFFDFARLQWPTLYKPISESWIEMLQPPRHIRTDSRLPVRQFYSLEDVLKIASVSTETLRQERGQVAVCMLFLSGMRADALASLPRSCVDLPTRQISQLPEAGVRTKNRKAALTFLLEIPELLDVCIKWDQRVRQLPPAALWYATLTNDGMVLTPTIRAFEGRSNVIERDVRLICQLAGVDYLSPHKLRHGHVVHALKQAHNMAELKAISQNVMHSSVTITDQVYGRLMNNDIREIVSNLGSYDHFMKGHNNQAEDDISAKLDELIALLKK